MFGLSAKIRETKGKAVKNLRKEGILPGIVYGPHLKPISLELDSKSFEEAYNEAGESSLISLKIEGKDKTYQVLIHEVKEDPLTGKFIHVDFYQPSLKEKIEANIPLVFTGEAEAIKNLGGTLVKNLKEIEVKALPLDLPHDIKVSLDKLKTFEDRIKVSDLEVSDKVEILRDPERIVALVVPPEKVEEELEKPIEEKVEEVERVEEKGKEEEKELEKEESKKEEKKEESSKEK